MLFIDERARSEGFYPFCFLGGLRGVAVWLSGTSTSLPSTTVYTNYAWRKVPADLADFTLTIAEIFVKTENFFVRKRRLRR